jgi:hypothetical protein
MCEDKMIRKLEVNRIFLFISIYNLLRRNNHFYLIIIV